MAACDISSHLGCTEWTICPARNCRRTATYAVLSIGGFLAMNKSFYPLPFALVSYDAVEDDYVVTTDRRVLEGGPSWANNPPEFNQAYADRVSSYYGVPTVDVGVGLS